MNPKLTLWLTALAVALFAYIYFVDLHPSRSTGPAQPLGKLLPGLDPGRVSTIEITRSNQTVRAELHLGQWRLTDPRYPAQATAIESFLNVLATLTRQEEISAQEIISESGGLSPFGLDPPLAVIRIRSADGPIQLRVGAKTLLGDRVYVQPVGAPGILVTDASLLAHLPVSTDAWRNPMLIHQDAQVFDSIAIVANARPLRLERDPANQAWRLVEPKPARRADFGRVEYLVQQLLHARVTDFVSDNPKVDLEPYGLQPPATELTLASGSNVVFQMQFGQGLAADPGQVYARRMSHTNIVLVSKELADLVGRPYMDFRDRLLLSFRPALVDRIEAQADEFFAVQRTNGPWRIVEPFQAPADQQLMQLFLQDLAKIEIVRFEKDVVTDFSPYGLHKPSRQYILKNTLANASGITNRTLMQVDFGAIPTDELDTVFCRRGDESSVYVVAFADMFRLERAAFALRDRRVWNFASSNVVGVTVVQRGHKRELARDPVTRTWIRDNPPANAAIEETLHRLGELQAESWVARGQSQAEKLGAAGGKYDLTLQLNEGGPLKLSFGSLSSSGQPYAAVTLEQGEPVVFKFPALLYGLVAEYLNVPVAAPEQ